MNDSPPLEVRRVIEAPRERVFAAWTRPEDLRRWWGVTAEHTTPLAELDLRVGGRYRLTMRAADGTDHTVAGTYEEISAPGRIVYTWQWESEERFPQTRVTAEFAEKAPGYTEIVLTHEGLPDEESRAQHRHGWLGCLEMLNRFLTISIIRE
ncbi:MAG: SRPBCC domain-containing protein [Chrysiogenetes bacterium]|nr:SRPBCC domain-containing protein [Chrysiogenetes bacterium]